MVNAMFQNSSHFMASHTTWDNRFRKISLAIIALFVEQERNCAAWEKPLILLMFVWLQETT